MDNRFISRFWENYIVKLNTYGIKPKGARWYVRHAEQYLRTFPDWCLAIYTVQDVEQYLQDKGRKAGLEDWQFQQIVISLQVLFVDIARTPWASTFSWQNWSDNTCDLSATHAAVARGKTSGPDLSAADSHS